ncbi:MAG: DUF6263 family protein [Chitinophagaceae bacterium]
MLKKCLLSAVVVLTAYIAVAQTDSGRLLMHQGQVFNVEVTLNNSITQQAMGQAIDITVDGKAFHNYKVTDTGNDLYTLHHEAQKLSFSFSGMGSKKSFDSGNKKDISSQWGEPVKKLLAKKYDMVLDSSGTVIKVTPESFPSGLTEEQLVIVLNMLKDLTSVTEPPLKGSNSFFRVLPGKVTAVGDTWTTQVNTPTETSVTDYKLESIGDSTVTVSFESNGKSSLKAQVMGMESVTSLNNVTNGTILINRQTGIIKEKNSVMVSTGTAEMMGNTTPVHAKTTIGIRVLP